MYGGLVEGDAKKNAMVIRFANEARVGAKNLSARVKAVMIYRYGQNEIDIAGCWLYEKGGAIDSAPDSGRHKLLVGTINDSRVCHHSIGRSSGPRKDLGYVGLSSFEGFSDRHCVRAVDRCPLF